MLYLILFNITKFFFIYFLLIFALHFVHLLYIQVNRLYSQKYKPTNVLIIGGSEGLGLSFAEKSVLLRAKNIILVARSPKKLEVAKSLLNNVIDKVGISNHKCEIYLYSFDITNEEVSNQIINEIYTKFVNIDLFIFNAGIAIPKPLDEITSDEIKTMINLNFTSTILVTTNVLNRMKKTGGKVLLVSSESGIVSTYGYSVYSATKFGLRGFSDAANMEYNYYNIQIYTLFPPCIDTPGFKKENEHKSKTCKEIENTTVLLSSTEIVDETFNKITSNLKYITYGYLKYPLVYMSNITSPYSSITSMLCEIVTLPLCRLIMIFVQRDFYNIVKKNLKL